MANEDLIAPPERQELNAEQITTAIMNGDNVMLFTKDGGVLFFDKELKLWRLIE